MLVKENGCWVLYTHDGGRILGKHESRDKALAQERAIQASKHRRANPSEAVSLFDMMCSDLDTPDVVEVMEENYPKSFNSPEELLEEENPEDVYSLRNFKVLGVKGRMLRVYPEQAIPIEGNIFDYDKLCAVAESPNYTDHKIPFYTSLISPFYMRENDIAEALNYQEQGHSWIENAVFDEDDEGEVFFQVRDGNHRLFGMLLSGEPYVWAMITSNDYQEYKEWVRDGKKEDARNAELMLYLDKNLA